jgi:hypothetical protein
MHENIQTHVECSNFVGSQKETCCVDKLCIMVTSIEVALSAAVSGVEWLRVGTESSIRG